jgi:hypothetical protein
LVVKWTILKSKAEAEVEGFFLFHDDWLNNYFSFSCEEAKGVKQQARGDNSIILF